MSNESELCEHCISTNNQLPCECCEHCRGHGCWLGADCSCGNELDWQFTALRDEVRAWRKVWAEVCGLFYSQNVSHTHPDLAMIYENGRIVNEGQNNVLRLNMMLIRILPKSVTHGHCGPCEYESPMLDNECLVCGSPASE